MLDINILFVIIRVNLKNKKMNYRKIPIKFKERFPLNFINDLNGWSFSQKELSENKGKILTLDIDLGNNCSLDCPHCFRRTAVLDKVERKITFEETKKIVLEAKKLGLRSIKFLGAGEPFENVRFVEFLRFLKSQNVLPIIFTKGHVLGDNSLIKKYNRHYGILNSNHLIKELNSVNASIVLGFNSFNSEKQDYMVGKIHGYTQKRDRALKELLATGFNSVNPTRLAFGVTPITKQNCDEIFSIYKWCRERNIYVIAAPTMVGGRASNWEKITPTQEDLVNLYTKIYKFNIKRGIQTVEQLKNEGVSAYAGGHPCNQISCGMYITLSGKVLRCPGDDVTILGNIFEKSLEEIWLNSENFQRSGTFNCKCPPKIGKSFDKSFFEMVEKKLNLVVGVNF